MTIGTDVYIIPSKARSAGKPVPRAVVYFIRHRRDGPLGAIHAGGNPEGKDTWGECSQAGGSCQICYGSDAPDTIAGMVEHILGYIDVELIDAVTAAILRLEERRRGSVEEEGREPDPQ